MPNRWLWKITPSMSPRVAAAMVSEALAKAALWCFGHGVAEQPATERVHNGCQVKVARGRALARGSLA
jgi:hypothetical protein